MAISAKDLQFVGIEHNKLLEKTYQALYDNNVREKESQEFTRNFLVETILEQRDYSEKSNVLGANFAAEYVLNPPEKIPNLYVGTARKVLTSKEKQILDKLEKIIETTDPRDVDSKISELEKEISNGDYDEKQLVTLYSATNVGRFSSEYWSQNGRKWAGLSNNSKKSVGGDIVKGDIAGAVGGAVGAFAVNIIPGAGQLAYGSAIISGAVGFSVATAVNEFLDWVW